MTLINWLAILGALAWLPHLLTLLRQLITRPEIRIITERKKNRPCSL